MPASLDAPTRHRDITDHELYGRPMASNKGKGLYGLPYLNNGSLPFSATHTPEWHGFFDTTRCVQQRLCMYCGNRMTGPIVLVKTNNSHEFETSGVGAHPTCALYATRSCPHITRDAKSRCPKTTTIAYVVIGEVGLEFDFGTDGRPDVEQTVTEGFNYVVDHAIPISNDQLRELAREYPER